MTLMRVIIWLGLPIGVAAMAASLTMLMGWSDGRDVCTTWLAMILTYCP